MAHKQRKREEKYNYNSGFGNEFQTEARPNCLPQAQNNPQKCPEGLYCEQITGSSFTAPRCDNRRSWVYRTLPSVVHSPYVSYEGAQLAEYQKLHQNPNQMRWSPLPDRHTDTDFVDGLVVWCGAGSPELKSGTQIYLYNFNSNMHNKAFYNADGELLIVPQQGKLDIQTELGFLEVFPGEIVVIPRGIVFSVQIPDGGATRGYVCEIYESYFNLPNLGPIGANGLANPRDFKYPVAAYSNTSNTSTPFTVVTKFGGKFFKRTQPHSPFNVVAWHGNYSPYKYDLDNFCCINSVTYDHPDPSIYCVLTAQSAIPGTAVIDFVIFPPRWEAKDHTFRPPYYHRNCMSEFMGLIRGEYEAKKEGFFPGCSTLHNCMTPHGPDTKTFEWASNCDISVPTKLGDTMAFMFETNYVYLLSESALQSYHKDYYLCWQDLKNYHTDFLLNTNK